MTSSSPGSPAGPNAPPPAPISPALDFFAGTVAGPPLLLSPPTCTPQTDEARPVPGNRDSEPRDGPSVRHRCVHAVRHTFALQDGVLTAVSLPLLDVGSSYHYLSRARSQSPPSDSTTSLCANDQSRNCTRQGRAVLPERRACVRQGCAGGRGAFPTLLCRSCGQVSVENGQLTRVKLLDWDAQVRGLYKGVVRRPLPKSAPPTAAKESRNSHRRRLW